MKGIIMAKSMGKKVQYVDLTEARGDGRNINIVTRAGAKTGPNAVRHDPTQH
jgi:hypothetical protein